LPTMITLLTLPAIFLPSDFIDLLALL